MAVNIPRPVGCKRRCVENNIASVPMVFMKILINDSGNTIEALIDTGASETLVYKKLIKGHKVSKGKRVIWETTAGKVSTVGKCDIMFQLLEFSNSRTVHHTVHVMNKPMSSAYDAIIGQALLDKMSIDIK